MTDNISAPNVDLIQNKHFGHSITIWENTAWLVNLKERSADFGDNSQFDDNTPLYCHDCQEELAPEENELFWQAVTEVVEER